MTALPSTPDLVTITTPGGARFSVARAYKDQFQGLVNDLEAKGYTIDPSQSGGYNPRYIAGTQTPSEHAYGRAIDVNWNLNPRGGAPGNIPADVARAVAQQYHMTWGGDWSGNTRDPMHFEVGGTQGVNTGTGTLGVANANMPTPPVPPPGGPSSTVGPETNPASMQQAPSPQTTPIDPVLAAAAFNGGGGIAGGPASLSDAFARAMQAGPLNRPITYPS
jgi:hypothetical protein